MLQQFAESLTKLTWSEMDKVAICVADEAAHCLENDEVFDPRRVAELLSGLGSEILREAEMETAAKATGSQSPDPAT